VHLILEELKKIKLKVISQDEFKRAREFYLGQLMLALEDTLDHMLWIGETTAAEDKTYPFSEIIKEVNKVNREDVREVAQSIFTEKKLNLALIGPLKDKQEEIRQQLHL
jgi:predicted Zn-dependent peptidase